MESNGILTAFKTTYKGLATEREKLQAISENIANAKRAPDKNGNVYRKKVVMGQHGEEAGKNFSNKMNLELNKNSRGHFSERRNRREDARHIKQDDNEKPYQVKKLNGYKMEYNPTHPRANKNGYIKKPDINVVEEMVNLMSASRAYEANVNVMDAAKKMANNALKI